MNCVNGYAAERGGRQVTGFYYKWHTNEANNSYKANCYVITCAFGSKTVMVGSLRCVNMWHRKGCQNERIR